MAKSKKQQNKQPKPNGKKGRRRNRSRGTVRPGASLKVDSMLAYDRLIRDPCAGNFAYPPYAGVDSGYLIRITATFVPAAFSAGVLTVGNAYPITFAHQIQPSTFPAYTTGAITTLSGANQWTTLNFGGSFLSNSAVKAFRPVAACMKWVPTGAINIRAGVIACGYSTAPFANAATGFDGTGVVAGMLERVPNGSGEHEIRWLPNPSDETFTPNNVNAQSASGGTICIAGQGVDGVATASNVVTANGVIEYTAVYEWIPYSTNYTSVAPKMPPPFTSQEYQSTIGNVGEFLLRGVRTAGDAMRGVSSVVQQISSLTSRRAYLPTFPLID